MQTIRVINLCYLFIRDECGNVFHRVHFPGIHTIGMVLFIHDERYGHLLFRASEIQPVKIIPISALQYKAIQDFNTAPINSTSAYDSSNLFFSRFNVSRKRRDIHISLKDRHPRFQTRASSFSSSTSV